MNRIQILDGGMGRELKRIGAPFRQPEWSALALLEAPHFVARAHDAFIGAGADIITTNSYAVVPFHLGTSRFAERGYDLATQAAHIARECATRAPRPVLVAGSLPPVLGSYRPDLFDRQTALAVYQVLIAAQQDFVDLWLAETQSSIAEIEAVGEALAGRGQPRWFSFTLADGERADGVRLRSGEAVKEAVAAALDLSAAAILFNCSQPEVMGAAVREAVTEIGRRPRVVPVGVYANGFPPQSSEAAANVGLDEIRADLGPETYLAWARQWVRLGASIIGGCCGITPAHIAVLARELV